MGGLEDLESGNRLYARPWNDHEPRCQPLAEDIGERAGHGPGGLAESDEEDLLEAGQVECHPFDPDEIALTGNALPNEAFRLDRRDGRPPDGLGVVQKAAFGLNSFAHTNTIT